MSSVARAEGVRPFFLHSYGLEQLQPGELAVATRVFGAEGVSTDVCDVPVGSVVVPRFRVLPFGRELEEAVVSCGSRLVNSWRQHEAVADVFHWVPLLDGLTAPAYRVEDMPGLPDGEWFVKGATNSVKHRWFECCYAPSTRVLPEVVRNTQLDSYVGTQEIVIRPFQWFRTTGYSVTGHPVFHERRCFTFNGVVLSTGNYWVSYPEYEVEPLVPGRMEAVLADVLIRVAGQVAPFLVVDLAEHPDGDWSVVELNDGAMSGLSGNDPTAVWGGVVRAMQASSRG